MVLTAGLDSQKNHSLGIFRDGDDQSPLFRNTAKLDLPEAYASFLVPVGNGLTLKAGKWATLIGYEGYESPKHLNFSRDFLYTLGNPIHAHGRPRQLSVRQVAHRHSGLHQRVGQRRQR